MSILAAQPLRLSEPDAITDRQGLPQAFVSAIVQDRQGFIWMATLDGLCRYDGRQFKVFQPTTDGRPSLSAVGLFTIKSDTRGRLWVAGQRSFDQVDPVHETFRNVSKRPFYKSFADYRLKDLYPDRHNRLWLLFENRGFACIELQTERIHLYRPDSAATHTVRDLLEDHNGTIWLASANGLNRVDPQTHQISPFQTPGLPMPERDLYKLHQRANGDLLIISRNYLLVVTPQTGQQRVIHLPKAVAQNDVVQIATDRQGNEYVAYHDVLFRFNAQETIRLVEHPEHPNDPWQSHSLFVDRSDVLWIGTTGSGVRKYNLQSARFDARPYQTNFYTDLLVNGLGLPRDRLPDFPAGVSAYDFRYTVDRQKRVWFTIGNTPVYQFDRRTNEITTLPIPSALQAIDAHYPIALATDPEGNVWAIRDSVAVWYDESTKNWQRFPYPVRPSFTQLNDKTTVFQVVVDAHALWLSTGSQGLYRVDRANGNIRQFRNQPRDSTSLSSNTLFYLSDDPADSSILWIGTFGGGLCRFDKRTGRCQRFTKQNGLPNNVVYAAIPDQHGYLWVATNQGLCRMDRRAGRPEAGPSKPMRIFNRRDGLQADEFNRFHALHVADDRIFLGGLEGITAFTPAQIRDDRYVPPVQLTAIRINNQPIDPPLVNSLPIQLVRQLDLRYDQNFLTVEFVALQFNNLDKLRYRYQLDGVDRGWILTDRPEAVYTNLSPGTYALRLNASNTSGVWSPEVRTLIIHIRPPWWASWWAYLAYTVSLIGIAAVFIRSYWRQKEAEQLKKLDAIKTRFFSNITHEFRTPLTLILAPAQQLQQKLHEPDDLRRLASIDRNAHQLLRLVNQLMDLSKLEAGALKIEETRGDLVQFIRELVQSFESEADAKGIQLTFRAVDMASGYYFDARKLERILYNLLSNALKFTPSGGQIEVRMAPAVVLTVADTGFGIPPEKLTHIFDRFYQVDDSSTRQQEGTGIGLALVKELVDLQKGSISVASEVGKGTTFTLTLPYQSVADLKTPSAIPPTTAGQPAENTVDERSDESPVVLLVEDNNELADFIADSLPNTYQMYRATNGAEGLEQAIDLVPDLIISDVLMPVRDGYTFCQNVKADSRTSHIPVILLTAKSSHDSRITGLTAGADDYITKPFHVQELRLRVQNRLEQRRQLRAWIRTSLTQLPIAQHKPSSQLTDPFLDTIYALIEANLDDSTFGADELIAQIRMSRMSLHRKLKALAGMSVGELIRNYRLRRATEFLRQGYNSSETAYRVGFDSPAYFSKCFREMYRLTPTEFAAQKHP